MINRSMMDPRPTTESSRREFVRGAARYLLLGALTAGGALATASRRTAPNPACVNQGICGGCPIFSGCDLPAALSVKNPLTGG